ncbi:O-antigen ligase family protein [Corynebacterium spheniscorum]|uniref:O-antigen ligase n=1 Tax=Corynebacterium spheniscorum TaxID=185761 RepID=A0A1I2T5U1_9CORY|nr:O-antigen ligase family protein [Corynebacterium spheniscorum]KAA8721255.1 O-antigen ligase family protein [Corynebacterium spheniscorum]SFG60190.1 O-antigen ligase [Corynebacterium spheniscorum]
MIARPTAKKQRKKEERPEDSSLRAPISLYKRAAVLKDEPFAALSIIFLVLAMFAGNTSIQVLNKNFIALPVAVVLALCSALSLMIHDVVQPASHRVDTRSVASKRAEEAEQKSRFASSHTAYAVMLFFLLWTLWLVVSAFWAPAPHRELPDVFTLILLGVVTFMVAHSLKERMLPIMWWTFFILGLVFVIGGFTSTWTTPNRMSAFGGGPNVFVRYMDLGMISALYLTLRYQRMLFLGALPIFFACAVLSGSRGGLVAAFAAAVFLGGHLWLKKQRKILAICAGLSVAGVILCLIIPQLRNLFMRLVLNRFFKLTLVDRYSSGRDEIADNAVDLIQSHPISGVGLGGYAFHFQDATGIQHPHNLFLTTITETGPLGLILVLVLLITIALSFWQRLRTATFGVVCAMAGSAAIFLCSMFSGYYLDSRLIWFFALVALCAPMLRSNSEAEATSPEEIVQRERDDKRALKATKKKQNPLQRERHRQKKLHP